VCSSVWQCVALCVAVCNAVWVVVGSSVYQGGAVYCSVVQCGAVCCSVLRCGAVQCKKVERPSTSGHNASELCSVLQCACCSV